jgi:hypothetical protein
MTRAPASLGSSGRTYQRTWLRTWLAHVAAHVAALQSRRLQRSPLCRCNAVLSQHGAAETWTVLQHAALRCNVMGCVAT